MPTSSKKNWDRISVFLIFNYWAQGMMGLIYEPLSYLLKDSLGLSAGQSASFVSFMTLPFLFQPVFAILSDRISFLGYRRKPHLIFYSLLAMGAFWFLSVQKTYSYLPLLMALVLGSVSFSAGDAVCDAVAVEWGQEKNKTGIYQSVKIALLYGTLVFTGLGAGWLTTHVSYGRIFLLSSVFPLLMFLSCFILRDKKVSKQPSVLWPNLRQFLSTKRFWALSFFFFLWNFYPFLGTAQFYYQSSVLKFNPVFIGSLDTIGGVAGFLGAIFYGRFCGDSSKTESRVKLSIWGGAACALLYLFYWGRISVIVVTLISGFIGVILKLILLDWAAQSCPFGGEATAFAIYMAVFDLAEWSSNTVGGKLYDFFISRLAFFSHPAYGAAAALSVIGAVCTLSCFWLLPEASREL